MNNKKLGIILIIACIVLGVLIFSFEKSINKQEEASCECADMLEGGVCAMGDETSWQTYVGLIVVSLIAALGVYLIFFEKSQKEIISTLENHKKVKTEEENFEILLKGLNSDEQKVIKAVREQDGITQQTLRLRTDLHKSKLSIVLDGLEKKDLISRVEKGKTKEVYLKIKI